MAYIGQTPSAVPLDSGDIADDIIDSQHYAAGSVDSAHISGLAASKLTGALPAISGANLTNLPTTDLTSLQTNLATNFFLDAVNHARGVQNLSDGFVDQFEDQTGVDDANSTNELYDATNDFYRSGSIVTKSYTGGNQTYVVPAGVTSITFKAWGAGGGGGGGSAKGGGGGFVQETISVTPGETLNIKVGGGGVHEGAAASQKGGGGGWTSIDRSATYLAGAGGGGGAGTSGEHGGQGGGTTGGSGAGAQPGLGGTQAAGGAAGAGGGSAGTSLTGGRAKVGSSNDAAGGYNGGGIGDGDNSSYTAGGGGGGYFGGGSGGGGGGGSYGGAAGGGSSYAPTGTNTQASSGVVANAGDANYPGSVGDGGTQVTGEHGAAVVIVEAQNILLVSESVTALAAPDTAHITLFKEDIDALTLNTDLLAWASRSKQTITATNATNVLNASSHGLSDTDRVILTSSGADLPNGLVSSVVYFVVSAASGTFKVSLTSGGSAVTFSDDGSGTHSVFAVTAATLAEENAISPYDVVAASVDVSGQPSDTDMTLFVQSKNTKDFKLHGQSLQWS